MKGRNGSKGNNEGGKEERTTREGLEEKVVEEIEVRIKA